MSWLKYGIILGAIGAIAGVLNGIGSITWLKGIAFPGWFLSALIGKSCVGIPFFTKCTPEQTFNTIIWVTILNTLVYIIVGIVIGLIISKAKKEIIEEITPKDNNEKQKINN